ncbi:polyketide cyclase, partial [Mesorhizobium sp. M4B.F.Ca.ET.150.01.1.1]
MFTTILIILVVIIAAVLVYAATRPNDFVVTRSASIKE